MPTQTTYGKAFEYACLLALHNKYQSSQTVVIEQSAQLKTASQKYASLPDDAKVDLMLAADAACRIIDRLEPQLAYPVESSDCLTLTLMPDSAGQAGDVRDVVCLRCGNNWEIGLSCKHNHEAVKHSRLSATIDFGREWFGKNCSNAYFDTVTPIFNGLRDLRDKGRNANNPVLWRNLPKKFDDYYVPVLNAFMEELKRLNENYPTEIPALLIKYLLGRKDFYKVITIDESKLTKVQVINIYRTLYKKSGKHKAQGASSPLRLPTRFYHIGFKPGSQTTIEVICDEGWNISMRLHNASTEVEPSLKFDVQLEALPSAVHTEVEPW